MKKTKTMILKVMFLLQLALCQGQTSTSPPEPPPTTSPPQSQSLSPSLSPSTSSLPSLSASISLSPLPSPSPPPPSTATQRNAATTTTTEQYSAIHEARASRCIEIAGERMQEIYDRKRHLFHIMTKKHPTYNEKNQANEQWEIDDAYHNLVSALAANLSVIPVKRLSNETLRRQVQRLSKLQLHGLNKHDYDTSNAMLRSFHEFVTHPMVCENVCKVPSDKMAMEPTIRNVMDHTKNKEKLFNWWSKWHDGLDNDDRARQTFLRYIELWRKAAALNGHVTPSRTWYLYYDSENFQRELEDVVWEIMPLYQELHAYIRHWARVKYGNRLTEGTDGAIPAPVMDQIIAQSWASGTLVPIPYPLNPLPNVKQRLEEVMETPIHLIKKAGDFFKKIGLKQLTKPFMHEFVRLNNADDPGKVCKVQVSYFPPDVALRFCNKVDYKAFLQMHGHVAELQYNMYKAELPFGLDSEPCPGFGSALGEAFIIASGTPRHLNRLAIIANGSLTPEQSLNRLFRMGIHTLLAIPQYFVNDKYLVEMMDRRIRPRKYNCEYWKLQHKFAGVVPPSRRNEKNFDPDSKFYKGLHPESPNTIKFISEVLGHQFYRSFCLLSGEYKPGNPNHPLFNCDFAESPAVGDIVKKMMKMGSTKHWRDVMQVATGERRLSAQGVMEYFAPLYKWLKEQNKQLGLVPGWNGDVRCGNKI